jgi:hypothetical protein
VERYRYMLRTAPPETVEQAHAEAFAKLTPDQRRKVLEDLGSAVPTSERATSDDPQSLARMATRAEMREPGTIERTLGGGRGGMEMGGMIAGTLLASVAGPSSAPRSPMPSSVTSRGTTRWRPRTPRARTPAWIRKADWVIPGWTTSAASTAASTSDR